MTAAPSPWQASTSRRIHGTTSSFQARMLLKAGGLSRDTAAEPAVMVMATPPRQRSTW